MNPNPTINLFLSVHAEERRCDGGRVSRGRMKQTQQQRVSVSESTQRAQSATPEPQTIGALLVWRCRDPTQPTTATSGTMTRPIPIRQRPQLRPPRLPPSLLLCLLLLMVAAWSALPLSVSASPPPLSQPLVALLDEAGQSHTHTRTRRQTDSGSQRADGERPRMAQPIRLRPDACRRMGEEANRRQGGRACWSDTEGRRRADGG